MNRCVVIGGAEIRDYGFARSLLRPDDFCVYCDGGLRHMEGLGAAAGLIVGDFDSHSQPNLPVETIVLPCEKDDTDTGYAVKEGLRRGCDEFLLLGVLGGRLDHTLGNVALLQMLHRMGVQASLADDYSIVRVVGQEQAKVDKRCAFFSLLCVSGAAEGIAVRGAKYPLENARLDYTDSIGVSNEVMPGEETSVSVEKGSLLLIQVYRDASDH